MKATIYHNPRCGTSRKTLAILEQAGADVTVVEYLVNPPSRARLAQLFDRAEISARDALRAKESLAEDLGLRDPTVSDEQILDAMTSHPILINRPLVETEKGVRLCRPPEVVTGIL